MKRILGAIAAGVIAFSGIYALAASLSVTSNNLGAGVSAVAACQSATLNVTYTPEAYSSTVPGYTVSTVTVNNLQNTCYSVPYRVTLYQTGGTSLGEATGTTPASGTTFTASFTNVSAAAITGVAVVLGG
ncbi:MAG TPA: hypothetical protein VEK76_13150 [Candidatus Binatia bacterium]|nr:hypothetical protein [Candidatus Binatia bacterium]